MAAQGGGRGTSGSPGSNCPDVPTTRHQRGELAHDFAVPDVRPPRHQPPHPRAAPPSPCDRRRVAAGARRRRARFPDHAGNRRRSGLRRDPEPPRPRARRSPTPTAWRTPAPTSRAAPAASTRPTRTATTAAATTPTARTTTTAPAPPARATRTRATRRGPPPGRRPASPPRPARPPSSAHAGGRTKATPRRTPGSQAAAQARHAAATARAQIRAQVRAGTLTREQARAQLAAVRAALKSQLVALRTAGHRALRLHADSSAAPTLASRRPLTPATSRPAARAEIRAQVRAGTLTREQARARAGRRAGGAADPARARCRQAPSTALTPAVAASTPAVAASTPAAQVLGTRFGTTPVSVAASTGAGERAHRDLRRRRAVSRWDVGSAAA